MFSSSLRIYLLWTIAYSTTLLIGFRLEGERDAVSAGALGYLTII